MIQASGPRCTWARARKRILAIPDGRGAGIEDLEPLVAGADVVITDLSPRRWAESFPSLEAMVETYPGVVFVDVSRFGRVGPYVDYLGGDLVLLALSGYLFMCGLNDREPLRLGIDLVDIVTGVNAAGGAMAGLHHARRTGQGQVVEVSALRTMLGTATSFPTSYSFQGTVRRRSSTAMVSVGIMVPCRDGHALVNTFRTPSEMLFVLLDDERLLDERFSDFIGREINQQSHGRDHGRGGRQQDDARAVRDRSGAAPPERHGAVAAPDPVGPPARCAALLPTARTGGRHDRAGARVAGGSGRGTATSTLTGTARRSRRPRTPYGATNQSPARRLLRRSGTPSRDLKVVELTFAWAGPFMGRILGDHGAQVVKIESRRYPDTARGADLVDLSFGENDRWMDRSLAYIIANPAKYHVGMDLTDPAGKEVLLDLVRWADVIIENFTPRVLPNLGLGWDLFHSVNPSVIMISATGFGQQGPYRDYGAWGWGLECQAGITHATGYLGDPDPLLFIPTIPDPLSAAVGVAATLAALEERRRTGKGQLDRPVAVRVRHLRHSDRTSSGAVKRARIGPAPGNRHAWKAPQGVYPCAGRRRLGHRGGRDRRAVGPAVRGDRPSRPRRRGAAPHPPRPVRRA